MTLVIQVSHDEWIRIWYKVLSMKIPFNYRCNNKELCNLRAKITFYADYKNDIFEIGVLI